MALEPSSHGNPCRYKHQCKITRVLRNITATNIKVEPCKNLARVGLLFITKINIKSLVKQKWKKSLKKA